MHKLGQCYDIMGILNKFVINLLDVLNLWWTKSSSQVSLNLKHRMRNLI